MTFRDDDYTDVFESPMLHRIQELQEENKRLKEELERLNAQNHGLRWSDLDRKHLWWDLQRFIGMEVTTYKRTRQGFIIKLLRILKEEYPEDWEIAHRR
jgi:hypothetical protein